MKTRRTPWLLAVGLAAAVVVGGGSALGSHHLAEEESKPARAKAKPTKIVVIVPAEHTMPVDGALSLEAKLCDPDGSKCDIAAKATWAVKPKSVAQVEPKRGAMTLLTANEAGSVTVTAKQGKARGTAQVTLGDPAGEQEADGAATEAAAGAAERRLYVVPQEAEVGIGEEFVITAWGCPQSDVRVGQNGVADGQDDQCTTEQIFAVRPDATASLVGTVGPSALLSVGEFTGPADGDSTWFGVQVVTGLGGTIVDGIALNQPVEGSRLGDLDGDEMRDGNDILALFPDGVDVAQDPIAGDAVTDDLRALDLNSDGSIDATDAGLFGLLEMADGAEPSGSWGAVDASAEPDEGEESTE